MPIAIVYNQPVAEGQLWNEASRDVLKVVEETQTILEHWGYKVYLIPVTKKIDKLIASLQEKDIELCFNFCESVEEKAVFQSHICGILELLDIPYTGSSLEAMAITTNKILTKYALLGAGVSTPAFGIYDGKRAKGIVKLNFPVIVKPAYEDGSVGIETQNIFTHIAELLDFLPGYYKRFKQPILIEEFIKGREFTVSLLGYPTPKLLPIAEIKPRSGHIVDYQAKWQSHDNYAFFPNLPSLLKKQIQKMALRAFEVTSCRDYVRIDFRLASNAKLYVLEVNANPCLSPGSTFLKSAAKFGLSYEDIVRELLECALKRQK